MKRVFGFTLMELMVVVFIIALASGALVFRANFQNANEQLRHFSERLKTMMTLAREEAILQFNVLGMSLGRPYIYFYQYDDQSRRWKALNNDNFFWEKIAIPNSLEIEVIGEQAQNGMEFSPQIIFYSSGEITPFKILLKNKNLHYEGTGLASGQITFQRMVQP